LASTNEDLEKSRQKILKKCDDQITWYEKTKSSTITLHLFLAISTIVLGGLTPVLILWSDLPKPIQALPSALAAMTVALDKTFRPRENYARMSYFAETIKKVPPQGAGYGNRLLANRWFPLQVYIFRPKGRGITPILD
jgi:hypothetical protein